MLAQGCLTSLSGPEPTSLELIEIPRGLRPCARSFLGRSGAYKDLIVTLVMP